MPQVYLSTYCTEESYGSVLQALGLAKALERMGCSVAVLRLGERRERFEIRRRGGLGGRAVMLQQRMILPQLNSKFRRCGDFIHSHLDVRYFPDDAALRKSVDPEAIYIAGSDQIWNPRKLEPMFFLDFLPPEHPKYSYAASMGRTDLPPEQEAVFARLLSGFSELSVRERACVSVLQKLTDQTIHVHIDPTFLHDADFWQRYEAPYPIKDPYYLVFAIYWDSAYNEQLRRLHQETGKPIVVISNYRRSIYADRWLYDVDIGQFLWLIDHAEGVISSSFHGCALSLNFGKPLAAVIDPGAPSRISCLLDTLGCENRSILSLTEPAGTNTEASRAMQREREKGYAYLRSIFSEHT